jgi:hypothetical protein
MTWWMWMVIIAACVVALRELYVRSRAPRPAPGTVISIVELRFVEPAWTGDGRTWVPIRVGDKMTGWLVRSCIECGVPSSPWVSLLAIDAHAASMAGHVVQLEVMADAFADRGHADLAAATRTHADVMRGRTRTLERTLLVAIDEGHKAMPSWR